MKLRRGRLNIVEFIDEKNIRKTGIIKEITRPYRLKVEGWALSQARSRGVNVPFVIDYYQDESEREVIIFEKIQGRSLLLRASQEHAQYLFSVGRQLALLAKDIISVNYGWINPISMVGSNDSWKSFVLSYAQKYGNRLVQLRIIKESDMQKLYEYIDYADLKISGPRLINRDIKPSNIIVGENGKVWIVDWENVLLGDPLYDLAIFGVKYGHGILWENLMKGSCFDASVPKYALYEIIGLIGIIDFYQKHCVNCCGRQEQLHKFVERL